jgi:NADPH-dependent ferric siderophore reductase
MMRISFMGPNLSDLTGQPAASVRLLLPSPGKESPEIPTWNGNEFLLSDGSRPIIRTLTPRRVHPDTGELDLEIVLHQHGALSDWARSVRPGERAAISGPGRGYDIDAEASGFLLAGDETALPAIGQLLESLPSEAPVLVLVEIARPDARFQLPAHPRATIEWVDLAPGDPPGTALAAAVQEIDLSSGTRLWAAGEAAAMQRLRRYFFEALEVPRSHAVVRGYWKHGRRGN